jgi:hypothetical protein
MANGGSPKGGGKPQETKSVDKPSTKQGTAAK